MNLRKVFGPLLALLLLVGVGLAVSYSYKEKQLSDAAALKAASRVTVKILTGSEKESFLTDPELKKILSDEGMILSVQKAGSREIATRPDLKSFDVAYPAGVHASVKIAQITGSKRIFTSFYTPMVVASWRQLIPLLEKNGLVASKDGAYFIVDMAKLVDLMRKGTRWKDLPGNQVYAVSKSILVSTTDVRKSNSAAMYLALASYVSNGSNVVVSESDADKIAGGLVGLFTRQGFQDSSSSSVFEDYAAMGLGKAPLVMLYEQQFLEYMFSHTKPNPDMVLLYPAPTVLSKHTIVALTDNGARFAQVMTTNPKVNAIAQRYGFRSQENAALLEDADRKKLAIPRTVVDVVDPPSYEILEKLIDRIDAGFKQ
jgi:hypothetical protein